MRSILKCLMRQHDIDHPIAFVADYLDLLSTKRLELRERGACSLRETVHTWYKYRKRLALKQKGCYNMSMTLKFTHVDDAEAFDDLEATTEDSGKRVYKTPSGISYPSVTTVVGFKKRAFFAEWRRKNPEESRRVLSRGNTLHSVIEDYLDNKDIHMEDCGPNSWQLFEQLRPELDKINNVHAQEVPLYSDLLQLAGRVDCVAEYDGKLSIIDFKGSTRNKTADNIEEYFMQATAYAIMWQERTGTAIDQVVILMSCETGDTNAFVSSPVRHVKNLKKIIEEYNAQ